MVDRAAAAEALVRGRSFVIANTWSRGKAAFLTRVATRPATIPESRRIVSFTFDDVPRSAVANAAPVLDEYGVKGTFYVAPGMPTGEFVSHGDIRTLAAGGHHIGCHTLTHYSLARGTAEGLYRDALAGKDVLDRILGEHPTEHFSNPYGAVSVRAKTLLQSVFATMRTSRPGVNVGGVDLSYLRAEPLYSYGPGVNLDRVRRRLRSLAPRGGWLILYTHGVSDPPGRHDSSRDDFRRVTELVMGADASVLSIPEALAAIRRA
jgi:peptidoglycan/xylan/chitin deacetylase (PgdA/CDA1 family)